MKAIISTTYDNKYLFFWPIVAFCWDKLNVGTICFAPQPTNTDEKRNQKMVLIADTLLKLKLKNEYQFYKFTCPEHKEATYAQCSRLYGAALFGLQNDEILITSDIDMAVFQIPDNRGQDMSIFGSDLVPNGQYPICYATGSVRNWRTIMGIESIEGKGSGLIVRCIKTYQKCLEELLGDIDAEHFRGNFWSKDQETLYNAAKGIATLIPRARPGTQFAERRYDRDDAFLLERLSPDTIDFHMPRPGYEEKNFEIIMTVLKYHYPNDDLTWIENFRNEYVNLL